MVTSVNINDDSITGRFGNKLFVVATLIGLAKQHQDTVVLPAVPRTNNWKYGDAFDNTNVKWNISHIAQSTVQNNYHEPRFAYDPIPYSPNLNINGYFQSYKYFENADKEVHEAFKMNDYIRNKILNKYNKELEAETVSIHVRRGDYMQLHAYHPTCSMQYYSDAIKHFKDCKYVFICSDDINYCKQAFAGKRCIFIEENDMFFDFFLMTLTTHNIIANSSFSWWSAYLNNNKEKKVIAPKIWFGPALKLHDTSLLKPIEWIEI